MSKRTCPNKSEECEEGYVSPFEDPNLKVVKVKMNKLVPLSMDRLKERLKLLWFFTVHYFVLLGSSYKNQVLNLDLSMVRSVWLDSKMFSVLSNGEL